MQIEKTFRKYYEIELQKEEEIKIGYHTSSQDEFVNKSE